MEKKTKNKLDTDIHMIQEPISSHSPSAGCNKNQALKEINNTHKRKIMWKAMTWSTVLETQLYCGDSVTLGFIMLLRATGLVTLAPYALQPYLGTGPVPRVWLDWGKTGWVRLVVLKMKAYVLGL